MHKVVGSIPVLAYPQFVVVGSICHVGVNLGYFGLIVILLSRNKVSSFNSDYLNFGIK